MDDDENDNLDRTDISTYWFYHDNFDDLDRDTPAAEHFAICTRGNKPARCLDCYGLYRAGYLDWQRA